MDEEFEMLLDEIPHATSHNHHQYHHMHQHEKNQVNESLHGMYVGDVMYDDDPSSYFLNHTRASPVSGFSLLSDGSSSSLFSQNGQSLSDHGSPTPPPLDDSLFGELGLCRNLSKMYISNDQENFGSSSRDFDQINVEKLRNGFSDFVGIQSPVSMNVPLSVNGDRRNMAFSRMSNFLGSQMYPWLKKDQACTFNQRGNSLSNLSMYDGLIYGQTNGLNWSEGRGELNFHGSPRLAQATRAHPNVIGDYTNEDSLIIQGDGINYVINNGLDFSRGLNKGSPQEIGVSKHREGRSRLDNWSQFGAARRNVKNAKLYNSFSLPTTYTSLAEARGYIYLLAKDQHGCRFLQRLFDEGTRENVEIIFKEIIHHVVELMMNPFGNYLMQKLLEECNEEQRMQILLMATEEPGELVRISLNTHGTRVVQTLIETLKTRQQISVVISALEPGFISLIKDLNGNHVVQRCLQCLSSEDNNVTITLPPLEF